jgi:diamine N-acetyltransferase
MYNIRKATAEDITLIRELTLQVWPQTYAPILSQAQIDYMLEMMYSPASLEKQMRDGAQFIIVYENETAVGFASYQKAGDAVFKLHKIYVLPSQQGKGTGKWLIEYIINEVKKEYAAALQLQVNRHNKARNFYEKLGFTVVKECAFDIGNGYVMDDYVMEKRFG